MKILFFASHPTLTIGYSRIANILTNFLAEKEHEIHYLAISNFKVRNIPRYINPKIKLYDALELEKMNNSNELYGVNVICDLILEIKPDILFLYNDCIVISRIFNNFIDKKIEKNFKIITYLDLVYEYQKPKIMNHINIFSDKILVFSDCWKENLIKMNLPENKINVLYHGFDNNKFFPVDSSLAKTTFGFKPDDFLILNNNRNNYRKATDKTIEAFIIFLKNKNYDPKIKLFINNNSDDEANGYELLDLINVICFKHNANPNIVILNHIFINSQNYYTDDMVNLLYNACDIGINTCGGEGFGLCNLEHAGIGKAQIISGVGALNDIFSDDNSIKIKSSGEFYLSNCIDTHGGYIKICNAMDFANAIDTYYTNRKLMNVHGQNARTMILDKYNWDKILTKLSDELTSIL